MPKNALIAILMPIGKFMYQRQIPKTIPQTTAHLAQTMTLLAMPVGELSEEIEKSLAENPALEISGERRCPTCNRVLSMNGNCPNCAQPKSMDAEELVIFISPRSEYSQSHESADNEMLDDPMGSKEETLLEYVGKQIAPDLEENEKRIAFYLLTQIDEDGLLSIDIPDTARYFHCEIGKIEKVRHLIQKSDPIGVGSMSPEEALMVQIDSLAERQPIPEFAPKIISLGLDALSKKKYKEIAQKLKCTIDEAKQALDFIANSLNPFPARAFWGGEHNKKSNPIQVYSRPDIILSYVNQSEDCPLMAEIVFPVSGTLQVNSLYKQSLRDVDDDSKIDMKADLNRATLFVKCIQQRNVTMQRMMEILLKKQRKFIKSGDKSLQSMTRSEVAKTLDVHESTISRAVSGKTVQLPNGQIIPLSHFFDRSLSIRVVVREIIQKEKKILSDKKISELLADRGINVARRTVAKYRAMEGILPAHLRKIEKQTKVNRIDA